jgi:hypothetical protein
VLAVIVAEVTVEHGGVDRREIALDIVRGHPRI